MKRAPAHVSDEEILAMDVVPVDTAAAYLGWGATSIRMALRECRVPFGVAFHCGSDSWTYRIIPEALVEFRHHGSPVTPWGSIRALVRSEVERGIMEGGKHDEHQTGYVVR